MQTTDTVFIVDDSMDIRQSFTAMVSNRGLRAESFSSGAEFLSAYNGARCGQTTGCLIVDVRLPGMSGLDVLEALGERGIRLPAIVVTGYGEIPKVARDRLVGQSTRPFNEWTDGLGVGSPADCDFDLCPAWIQESPAAAFPHVAPTVESSLALGAP